MKREDLERLKRYRVELEEFIKKEHPDNEYLKMELSNVKRFLDMDRLDKAVHYMCDYFHLTIDEIRRKNRKHEVVIPRHMMSKYIRENIPSKYITWKAIATATGNSHHATSINAYKTISGLIETNGFYRNDWNDFMKYMDGFTD